MKWLLILLICCLSFWSCTRHEDEKQSSGTLVLTGSSTVAPLAAEIAKRYESQHPGIRVDVQTGGSSRGIADARRGLAQIGMASRALKAEESDLVAHTIARDGICIITHKDNPVPNLTDEQVIGIFQGQITNWHEVGGLDKPITVVNKAAGRSTLELFLEYYKLKAEMIKADVIIGDNAQGIKTVAGNEAAIGYVSIGAAEYEASAGVPIRLHPVSGITASIKEVQDGSFPLSRPLNLVTSGPISPLAQSFIQFAQSSEVNDLIEELYFVPIKP